MLYTYNPTIAQRLYTEWKKHGSLIIGVDFDDTLFDTHSLVQDFTEIVDTLKLAQSLGAILCVWTANADKDLVTSHWTSLGLTYDHYNESPVKIHDTQIKPYFNLLLDDRAGLGQSLDCLQLAINRIQHD